MFKKNKKEKSSYGIIGLGRFGMALALELVEAGAEIIAIDKNEEKVREIREYTENAYVTKNLDKKTLEDTGIQNCDVAVVCLSEHLDTSILTTLNLVSFGIPTVIAKASSAEHGEILKKLGAQVAYPERDMGIRLAHKLECSNTLDFVQLSDRINISKLTVPEKMIGKSVIELDFRKTFGLNIVAVENGSKVTDNIRPDYVFNKEDIVYVVGNVASINSLTEWTEE